MGSLEADKFADMVILNSVPLSDINKTTKIDSVLLRAARSTGQVWTQRSLR